MVRPHRLGVDSKPPCQFRDHDLELAPLDGSHQVLRAGGVGRDEGQVDLGVERGRQLVLRLLRLLGVVVGAAAVDGEAPFPHREDLAREATARCCFMRCST